MSEIELEYLTKSPNRLRLAVVFSGRPRTLYEAAGLLGKKSGAIRSRVHTMYGDGFLSADPEPVTEGTVFHVKDEHQGLLDEALAEAQPEGYCLIGQRLLEVETDEIAAFYRVIKNREFSSVIAWMVELDGSGRRLLALTQRATAQQAELLQAALQDSGHSVRPGQFGEVISGGELRDRVRGIEIAVAT